MRISEVCDCITLMSPPAAAVTVGFAQVNYTVSEADGNVTVRLDKAGQAAVPVTVLFQTVNVSAAGTVLVPSSPVTGI